MTTMIERVARAMFEHDQLSDEAKLDEWDDDWIGPQGREQYMSLARAAVAAMREPTDAMVKAGRIYHADKRNSVNRVWKKMIDAELRDAADKTDDRVRSV